MKKEKRRRQRKPTMSRFPGPARSAVVFFSDIVGGSRISDILKPEQHAGILGKFHEIASQAVERLCKENRIPSRAVCDGGFVGDELALFIILDPSEEEEEEEEGEAAGKAAIAVLDLAIELNVGWFLTPLNSERIDNRATPFRLGTGLHYGTVILRSSQRGRWRKQSSPFKWEMSSQLDAEGIALNFGKRVEATSRAGSVTGIAVSQSFLGLCREHGLPVQVGPPLKGEAKGFEGREPIYELIGQDIVATRAEFARRELLKQKRVRYRQLVKAFRRDPEKTGWILELAMETLFREGSEESSRSLDHSRECFRLAVQLGEKAAAATPNRERILYRMARCLHRLAYTGSSKPSRTVNSDDAGIISKAIRCYVRASQDRDLIWAHNDLAAAYWRRATKRQEEGADPLGDFDKGLKACEDLVRMQPNHFYAYNLWALICAEKVLWIAEAETEGKTCTEKWREHLQPSLRQAQSYLQIARHIHRKPSYMYEGTSAFVERAMYHLYDKPSHLDSALERLVEAHRMLRKAVGGNLKRGKIPPEDFYLPGFAVPGFVPPRVEQLVSAWEKLRKRLQRLKRDHNRRRKE